MSSLRQPLDESQTPGPLTPTESPDATLLGYLAGLTIEERLRLNDSALRLREKLRTAAQQNG